MKQITNHFTDLNAAQTFSKFYILSPGFMIPSSYCIKMQESWTPALFEASLFIIDHHQPIKTTRMKERLG